MELSVQIEIRMIPDVKGLTIRMFRKMNVVSRIFWKLMESNIKCMKI